MTVRLGIKSVRLFGCAILALAAAVQAEPMVISFVPAMGESGVSRTAPIVFTFNEPINIEVTTATFMDPANPLNPFAIVTTWDAAHTRMTNTPVAPFPASKFIIWMLAGENPAGDIIGGETTGYFNTAADGGTGDCTNTVGSITLAKGAMYEQLSASAPTLFSEYPYAFVACSAVACTNWTTTNVSLLPPTNARTNLMAEPVPGRFNLTIPFDTPAAMESAFPNTGFVFDLQSAGSVTSLPMTLPSSLEFPTAPHLTNYAAAQAIDATKPFTLGWDAAGANVDCVFVEISGAFNTPALGDPSALKGSARTVTIPAGTLLPNRTYSGYITFYDSQITTNTYVQLAYRASTTEFSITTVTGGSPLVITNAEVKAGAFQFDILADPNQVIEIQTSTNLVANQWTPWLTTNSPVDRATIRCPLDGTRKFFRAYKPGF